MRQAIENKYGGRCFVVMPFSQTTPERDARYWTTFFKNYLTPTLHELGYECIRSSAAPNNIVQGIIENLFRCDVVLAILTDFNPNVWYELGVRHSIAQGTIMAIENGQKVPFDIAAYGVVKYDRHNKEKFKDALASSLQVIKGRHKTDSPVADFFRTNPVQLVRAASSVAATSLSTINALHLAQYDLFIVGQNLYSLAKDDSARVALFESLDVNPKLSVRIMIVDPAENHLIQALSQVIDETMEKDLGEAINHFKEWRAKWLSTNPANPHRFDIRLSNRIGNVSATFVDGASPSGLGLVRPTLFHTRPKERPCFLLTRRETESSFDVFFRVYDQQWDHARSIDKLGAQPSINTTRFASPHLDIRSQSEA